MDWKRLGPEMGTRFNTPKNSSERLRVKKFGAHPRIHRRINFTIGTWRRFHQLELLKTLYRDENTVAGFEDMLTDDITAFCNCGN